MRYFLEVSYKGTKYSGFQIQQNAPTIQSEVQKALYTYYRQAFILTGSSRTDAGVHAYQNYFHFDFQHVIAPSVIYNLNAILPRDISMLSLTPVNDRAHSRFDALSRQYRYCVYSEKNPFLNDIGWFYPYPVKLEILNEAAEMVGQAKDFQTFSKRNSQVHTTLCSIFYNQWSLENDCLIYTIKANRFLRGMVRALVATMLKVGRQKIKMIDFENLLINKDQKGVDFSAPASGLFLTKVEYPSNIWIS